jgi:hypothetical protein
MFNSVENGTKREIPKKNLTWKGMKDLVTAFIPMAG